MHLGIRTERYKLIHFYTIDEWELFDLEKDPHELKSIYGDPASAELVADLKKQLDGLKSQYKDDGKTVVKFERPDPPAKGKKGKGKKPSG